MNCKCIECGREYIYNDLNGYHREFCRPICHGINIGRNRKTNFLSEELIELREFKEKVFEIYPNIDIDMEE